MRILIANIHLKPGGNRSSLLNLLSNIDLTNNEVELFLFVSDEDARKAISGMRGVKLLDSSSLLSMFYTPYKTYAQKRQVPQMLMKRAVMLLVKAVGTRKTLLFLMLFQKRLRGYDTAISFAHDKWVEGFYGGCNDFVKRKVDAGRKVAWVHNDPYKLAFTREICERTYEEFDCIVNVSNACKEKFDEIVPGFRDKSKLVYNMFNAEEIRRHSAECDPYEYKGFRILTVSRMFNLQKRIDRIIECCRRLKADGFEGFRWHVVGDGPDSGWLRDKAAFEGVDDILFFEGHKDNPYPYMRYADVFVLTSRYEAQGMVVTESLITGTPVIVTDYEEAFEFVKNNKNGIITSNSTDGVYAAVKDILLHREKLAMMRAYISSQEFDNSLALEQFWSTVNG